MKIRKATKKDLSTITRLVKELARFEKLAHEVKTDPKLLKRYLFSKNPLAYALIAEEKAQPIGFALYFFNFSTFQSKPGLYLEDLFVLPQYRSKGVGLALFKALAKVAKEKNCGRFEWSVLNWNKSAIRFYKRQGAKLMTGWTLCRMDEDGIKNLASKVGARK